MGDSSNWHARRIALLLLFGVAPLGCTITEDNNANDPDAGTAPAPSTFEEACAIVPGCGESAQDLGGPRETIWRIDLHRDAAGVVEFGDIEPVDVLSSVGRPASPLKGSHLLVFVDGAGAWLEARAVRFADVAQIEGEGVFFSEEVAIDEQTVSAYVRDVPDAARFILMDASGQPVTSANVPMRTTGLGKARQPLDSSSSACGHVRLLGQQDVEFVPGGLWQYIYAGPFEPGPTQRAVVQAALNQMQPIVCHAVGRIAFVELDACPTVRAQVVGGQAGDMILINVAANRDEQTLASSREEQLGLVGTILHESGHALNFLLNQEGIDFGNMVDAAGPVGGWTFEAESEGWDTVEELRLGKGLSAEWKRMTAAFLDSGFGTATYQNAVQQSDCSYTGGSKEWGAEQVTHGGFMSRYGATKYVDDIAEMVALPTLGPLLRAEGLPGPEDYACQILSAAPDTDGVPLDLAAAYTKLRFVRTLGAISQAAFDTCVGNVGFESATPGFHVFQDGQYRRSFDQGVTAQIGVDSDAGVHVFLMHAEGQAEFSGNTYDGEMTLRLNVGDADTPIDQISWPRGGYELTEVHLNENSFLFHMPDAPAGSFDVSKGYVLVAEASNSKIEGSVVIQKVWRWLAPIPVPEVYDPPLVIRFLIEK